MADMKSRRYDECGQVMRDIMYPMASHTLKYKPSKEEGYDYEIIDILQGTSVLVTHDVIETLRKMDGKHSLAECFEGYTKKEAKELLRIYYDGGLLFRKSRIWKNKKEVLFRLYIPRKTNKSRAIIVNRILMLLPVPLMMVGCYLVKCYLPIFYNGYGGIVIDEFINNIIAILLSMIVHEYGHYCAAIATDNAYVCEVGFGFSKCVPLAYTVIDDTDIGHKGKRAQIMAGGIQANIMLMGISCLLLFIVPKLYPIVFGLLVWGIGIVVSNLMMIKGYDGEKIISSLLLQPGADIIEYSKYWLINKRKRKKCKNILLRGGISTLSIIIVIMRLEVFIYLLSFGILIRELVKKKITFILCIFSTEIDLVTALKPSLFLIGCLITGVFILIYYIPLFRAFASMYALILSYVFCLCPIIKSVIMLLKKLKILENGSNASILGQCILVLGASLLILHVLALVCTYIAGFIWPEQKMLVLKCEQDV